MGIFLIILPIIFVLTIILIVILAIVFSKKAAKCAVSDITENGFVNTDIQITINTTKKFKLLTLPTNGTVSALSGTVIVYSPNTDFIGSDNFIYETSQGCVEQNILICDVLFNQQGNKLVGTGATGTAGQGSSVAISNDGLTLVVGGRNDNGNIGAVWLYSRTSTNATFAQQGSKLVGTGAIGSSAQGTRIALSGNKLVLAVGGFADNSDIGAVWIYTRTTITSNFTQQGSKLVGTGNIGISYQGSSVALSYDGLQLAIGGSADNTFKGATWIFTRTSFTDVFVQQGSKLIGTGGIGTPNQGSSVSMSNDGLQLAVGGSSDNGNLGATWIFTRTVVTNSFTQQGTKLVGTGNAGINSHQGSSIDLSANGLQLAVGATSDDTSIGATWIFTRTAVTNLFTQQGTKLVGSNSITPQQGSVSLTSDGLALIVGGGGDNLGVGASWLFTRLNVNNVFTQKGSKIIGSGAIGNSAQGNVSISDTNGFVVGGPSDNSSVGAVWTFQATCPN